MKIPGIKQERVWPSLGMISEREMVIAGGYCCGGLLSVETLDLHTLERGELPDLPFATSHTGIGFSLTNSDYAVLTDYGFLVFDKLRSAWSAEEFKVASGRNGYLLAGERFSLSKGSSSGYMVKSNPIGMGVGSVELGGFEIINYTDNTLPRSFLSYTLKGSIGYGGGGTVHTNYFSFDFANTSFAPVEMGDEDSENGRERGSNDDSNYFQQLLLVLVVGLILHLIEKPNEKSKQHEIPSVDRFNLERLVANAPRPCNRGVPLTYG